MDLSAKERSDDDFWRRVSAAPGGGIAGLDTALYKLGEGRVALEKVRAFEPRFERARTILELGGGEGWLACMLKALYPQARVFTSDISPAALVGLADWERLFATQIDGGLACRSYALPFADESLDLVVVFASAHHFAAHRRTCVELARVLAPGGACLYLHEPSCRRFLHPVAHWRANKFNSYGPPEDVLVYPEIRRLAEQAGLECNLHFAPTTTNRGTFEGVYYSFLQRSRLAQRLLPCTVDYELVKRGAR